MGVKKSVPGIVELSQAQVEWERLIKISFFSDELGKKYLELVQGRRAVLGIG